MKNTEFIPADFDAHGRLRLPLLFWCVLLLQARTWVLFLMAGASRQQGDAILNLFYPDHERFWLGLLPGVPAVLAFLLSGYRQRLPRLWRAMRWLLVLSQVLLLLWQPDAMAERRISLLVDHCAAGRGWLCPVVAVNQPSPGRLFSPDHLLMALFADRELQHALNDSERIEI